MANIYTLTDGTTTVSLNAGSYLAKNYPMTAPEDRDGVPATSVVETLELMVSGANLAAIQSNMRAIETLLEAAKRRAQRQSGPRVYLTTQFDTEASAWRAEVFNGRLETTDAPDQFRRGKVDCGLIVERGPYEGAEVQLSLTNGNGTNVTTTGGGLRVFNCDDLTGSSPNRRDAHFNIDAAEVSGTLPAPMRIQFWSDTTASRAWRNWWLAVNAEGDPATLNQSVEGESRVTGYGTNVSLSTCSGSYYNTLSIAGAGQMEWDLDTTQVNAFAGYPYRVLVRFAGTTLMHYAQACLYDSTGLVLQAEGDLTELDGYAVADLGVLRIPADVFSTGYAALRLVIKFWCTGTQAAAVDYVQFMPAATTRLAIQRGMTVPNGGLVEINEVEGRAWAYAAGGEAPFFIMTGKPLMLLPGKDQRVYVLVTDSTGGSDIADKWLVQAWYRPRRWSV